MRKKLTTTEIDILRCFYIFPFLTAERVTRILFSPGYLQGVREYLNTLAAIEKKKPTPEDAQRKKYLHRERFHIDDPYLYWLADAGRDVLRKCDPAVYSFTNWKEPAKMKRYLSSQDFPHVMLTIDVLIACAGIPDLYPDIKVTDIMHYVHIHAGPDIPAKPDGVIKLILPSGKPLTIALEVDRGTESEEKIKDKVAGYIPYIMDGRFAHDYGAGEVPIIAFYAETETRQKQLLAWIELGLLECYGIAKASWFTVGAGTLSPQLFFENVWITPQGKHDRTVGALVS